METYLEERDVWLRHNNDAYDVSEDCNINLA